MKDLMKTGVVKFKRENVMLSYAYKSISLKLAKSTVLLLGKYQYNEGALELVVNCITKRKNIRYRTKKIEIESKYQM